MIIQVEARVINDKYPEYKYVEVQEETEDTLLNDKQVRQIAFRYVLKRSEKDFNELIHATSVLEVETIDPAVNQVMLSHIRS